VLNTFSAISVLRRSCYSKPPAFWQVLRDGAPLTLDVQLMKPEPLVPMHLAGRDPAFFVVAGARPIVIWVAHGPQQ
jgi:hypothetical protein